MRDADVWGRRDAADIFGVPAEVVHSDDTFRVRRHVDGGLPMNFIQVVHDLVPGMEVFPMDG